MKRIKKGPREVQIISRTNIYSFYWNVFCTYSYRSGPIPVWLDISIDLLV